MFKIVLDVLFPPNCIVCNSQKNFKNELICNNCYDSIHILGSLATTVVHDNFDFLWTLAAYEGAWLELIHKFKYEKSTAAYKVIETLLRERLEDGIFDNIDYVVPIPLHWWRYMRRGYNQAGIVARSVSSILEKPLLNGAIVRRKYTRQQVGLSMDERQINIKGVFRIKKSVRDVINERRVLLVDDVATTGATIDDCAGELKRAGAQSVDVLTLAKTL